MVDELVALGHHKPLRLSPPGFGAPVPDGWAATFDDYTAWLVGASPPAGSPEVITSPGGWSKVAAKPAYTDADLLYLFLSPSPEGVAAGRASLARTSFRRPASLMKITPEATGAQYQAITGYFGNSDGWFRRLKEIKAPTLGSPHWKRICVFGLLAGKRGRPHISDRLTKPARAPESWAMARGINIGDEVAITATVRRRVTEDRVSVSIPSYGFPHSIIDKSSKVKKGQPIELTGDVTHIDGDLVTVNLGVPITVNADTLRLVTAYKPPTRRTPLVDKPS